MKIAAKIPELLHAIDPGYAGAGCAVASFEQGTLRRAAFRKPSDRRVGVVAATVIVERPQWDDRSLAASAPVLMRLSWEGAIVAAYCAAHPSSKLIEVTPTDWKGSTPKPVHHARLWRQLNDDERAILGGDATLAAIQAAQEKGALDRWGRPGASYYPKSFTAHNLLDAVALGCTYLGRLAK